MFIAALFAIAQTQRQPKCPSIDDRQTNCETCIQENALRPAKGRRSAICDHLDDLGRRHAKEISRTRKGKSGVILLEPGAVQFVDGSRMAVSVVEAGDRVELLWDRHGVCVGEDEFLEVDRGDDSTTV